MSIRFRCPKCHAKIKVSDRHAGQKGNCSTCNAPLRVPTLEQAEKEARAERAKAVPPPPIPKSRHNVAMPTEAMEASEDLPKEPAAVGQTAVAASPTPYVPEIEAAAEVEEEFAQPLAASQEFVVPPPAAISQGEGNDILSAFALDANLIDIPGEDGEAHEEPLIRKSVGMEGVEELVDMTAMVDIVFFLLIFFMMTSMQNVLASIETPTPDPDKLSQKPAAAAAADTESDSVTIRIEADNTIKFDGEPVYGEKELRSRLSAVFQSGSSKKLTVMGHGDAQHGTVVMVLDAAHDAGIQDIKLTVADEEQ